MGDIAQDAWYPSVEGNTLINAGNALNINGSNVIGHQGDVTLIGRQVNVAAAQYTLSENEFHEVKQRGRGEHQPVLR